MKYALFLLITVIAFGCTNSEEERFPTEFEINIVDLGITHVAISWTESTDPNRGLITYDLYFDGQFVTSKTQGFTYRFDSLLENQEYNVEIIATNELGKRTTTSLTFSTNVNQPPSDFEIIEAGNSSENPMNIIIKWTESIDPEGGEISYNVYINDALIVTEIGETEFLIEFSSYTSVQVYVESLDTQGITTLSDMVSFENEFPTLKEEVNLRSQEEVDEFGANGYKILIGSITITEDQSGSITNLASMEDLEQITDRLYISGLESLVSLDGLESLKNDVFQDDLALTLLLNPALESVETLKGIKRLKRLEVVKCGLINLSGLETIESISGDVDIRDNSSLENLDHLFNGDHLGNIQSQIRINGNPKLTRIIGFKKVAGISNIIIEDNASLEVISGFTELGDFSDWSTEISIRFNPELTTISGFTGNSIAPSNIYISGNVSLETINGFTGLSNSKLTNSIQRLAISNNKNLKEVSGFEGESFQVEDLWINENDNLTSINVLSGFSGAGKSVNIFNNSSLLTFKWVRRS